MHGHFIRFRLQKIYFNSSVQVVLKSARSHFCCLFFSVLSYLCFIITVFLLLICLPFLFLKLFFKFQLLVRVYDHLLDVLNVICDSCFLVGLFSFKFRILLVCWCFNFFFPLSLVDVILVNID